MTRAFSSITLLFVSLLNSSHANQKSMFSSLNSVRRNCRKEFLPAGQHISLSKDWPQERTSSSVGLGLRGNTGTAGMRDFDVQFYRATFRLSRSGEINVPVFTVCGPVLNVIRGFSAPLIPVLIPKDDTETGSGKPVKYQYQTFYMSVINTSNAHGYCHLCIVMYKCILQITAFK